MTILWCGGEDIDFHNGTPPSISTVAAAYRSSYSRGALYYPGGRWYSNPFPGGEVLSAWLQFRYYRENYATTCTILGLTGPDGITGFWLYDNSRTLTLRKYDGGWSTLDSEGTSDFYCYTPQPVSIRITNYGASGNIKVYRWDDPNPVIDYTGDLTISGLTGFSRVGGYGGSAHFYGCVSEIIVADVDPRNMALKTLIPNAAGDANEWDSGDYTDIDELNRSITDLLITATHGDDFQANLTDMPAGDFKIKAVRAVVNAQDDNQIFGLKVGIKTNSAIHLSDSHRLTNLWSSRERLFQNNPETASAFSSGEIDALQLAIRCDSTTTTTSTTSTTTTTA